MYLSLLWVALVVLIHACILKGVIITVARSIQARLWLFFFPFFLRSSLISSQTGQMQRSKCSNSDCCVEQMSPDSEFRVP